MNPNSWAKTKMFDQDFNVLHLPQYFQFCPFLLHFVRIFIFGKVGSLIKNPKKVLFFSFDRNLKLNESEKVPI
jgi:hypothetical protein